MFHHVFEHIEDGQKILLDAKRLLSLNGRILLRIPTVDSFAWENYKENWSQLDAPRHCFLHSRKSLNFLAHQLGLNVERCWCDSTAFQFWGSELCKRAKFLCLMSMDYPTLLEEYFTFQQLQEFKRNSDILNRSQRGDQIAVVLTPT